MTLTATATFDSLNPATGEVVASFPIHDAEDVAAAVSRARVAATWWADLGFDGRRERLLAWRQYIIRHQDDLVDLVHRENGKPDEDAYLVEVVMATDHLLWAAKQAAKTLGSRKVPRNPLLPNISGELAYDPIGVVGVIGPWNYPVFTPMGSLVYALAAGNAVVFKPSEYTPAIGSWLADSFAAVVPEQPVFQVITGFGATGAALCRSGVGKIAFTGSAPTGRKIMAACAETLTPIVLELGGKDALLVAEDADLAAAARGALWGGLSNGGQTCVGIERVYVHERVYDEFCDEIRKAADDISLGADRDSYGPATMPKQIELIRRQVDEAVTRGAKPLVGGGPLVTPAPHGEGGWVRPTVLLDVPDDAELITEETFGPILPITKVASMDDAVAKANDSKYGLGASVWSKEHGREIAGRLRAGMVAINSVITFAALPALPFGGSGESGMGRIHGEDGLREFTRPKAYATQNFALPVALLDFGRPRWIMPVLKRVERMRAR